eukprot:9088557-Alexandrium_andersonii.AAC.1
MQSRAGATRAWATGRGETISRLVAPGAYGGVCKVVARHCAAIARPLLRNRIAWRKSADGLARQSLSVCARSARWSSRPARWLPSY